MAELTKTGQDGRSDADRQGKAGPRRYRLSQMERTLNVRLDDETDAQIMRMCAVGQAGFIRQLIAAEYARRYGGNNER